LVVAADDGVMPQTREHLAILGWLGVTRGAVAITKADRVDSSRLTQVRDEIAALTAGTFLEGAPVFAVRAQEPGDEGTAALRAHLEREAGRIAARRREGFFRLAIDRAFTLAGVGTVVTGTVHGGCYALGGPEELRLMPAGLPVRVRSIHAQNRPSERAAAGERCALNLPGVAKEAISRGDWIADARCFLPTRHLDVELALAADAPALGVRTPVHVHLAATHRLAHVIPLEGDLLPPGRRGLVQLVFEAPLCAAPGDRFIIRNAQASCTLGGGRVLDPYAPERKRRSPRRRAWLEAITRLLEGEGLGPLLEQAPYGVDEALLQRLLAAPISAAVLPPETLRVHAVWILPGHWEALAERLLAALERQHERVPDDPGVDTQRLRRMVDALIPEPLWQGVLDALASQGKVARSGPWWHLPGHATRLAAEEEALAARLLARLEAGGFDPPWVRDLARAEGVPEETVRTLLRKLARRGEAAQVVKDLFYAPRRVRELAAIAAELAAAEGGVQAARFRDATGLGRKRAVQILEFFDRIGYTRRVQRRGQDAHLLRGDAGPVFS
jgi:selenocysteine-specific elongation factor